MKSKTFMFIAFLAILGVGYWAYREGALDDMFSSGKANHGDRGPDGPVSTVPGLVSKIPGLAEKSKELEAKASAKTPDDQLPLIFGKFTDGMGQAIASLKSKGGCKTRLLRAQKILSKAKVEFNKSIKKLKPALDAMTPKEKKALVAIEARRMQAEQKSNKAAFKRFKRRCPRQAKKIIKSSLIYAASMKSTVLK